MSDLWVPNYGDDVKVIDNRKPARKLYDEHGVEQVAWDCIIEAAKFHGEGASQPDLFSPYEVVLANNAAVNGGWSALFEMMMGNGTATADQALTYFSNARAAIGVGDSATAHSPTKVDLQAASNKLRKGMNATFPQHTDGTAGANAVIVYQATFATDQANWQWNECALFNGLTGSARMLNRSVANLGTKTSASSWQITMTFTGWTAS